MVVVAPAEGGSHQLKELLQQAGAVFATRAGRPVAVNYGSSAGELAVCVTGVGLVDRSPLAKLVVAGSAGRLDDFLTRFLGSRVAPGGALKAGDAWWCRISGDQVIVLCERQSGRRLRDRLRGQSLHHVALSIRDCSDEWAAIELLGRNTAKVLRALGVYGESGDPRQAAPFTGQAIAGVPTRWLLQSDHRALALAPASGAGEVWLAIERLGRSYGLSCVGQEAAARYALFERAEAPVALG